MANDPSLIVKQSKGGRVLAQASPPGRYARKLAKLSISLSSALTMLPPFFLITLAPRGLFFEDILARFFLFLSACGESLWSPQVPIFSK